MKEDMGQLLDKIENSKFKSGPTRRAKKMIRKTLALNELEKAKAEGIRQNVSAVFSFLNSGYPKLPILENDDDLDKLFGNSMFIQKLVELPISIVFLPFVAIKMGINASKLVKWIKQKPELVNALKGQNLYDNIVNFSDEQKEYFNIEDRAEYFDHILDEHSPFPSEYDGLIDNMTEEYNQLKEKQAEEDREYDERRHR